MTLSTPTGMDRAFGLALAGVCALYFATFVHYGFHLGEDGDVVYLI